MKKLFLFSALLIFACSSDEGNDCVYEPTLSTEAVTEITETSATLNGVISIVSENCEVALGEMQGFVYSTNPSPTNDDNVEVVYGTDISTTIDNLSPNTTYYVRVFITNSLGEFYGNEIDFTTNQISLINCDGNPVPTIVYGTQEWTVENACHITYRDGTPIPQVTDNDEWANLTTGAWCFYDNNPDKGVLYNWYAIVGIYDLASLSDTTLRKEFSPNGWHIPTENDWFQFVSFLDENGYSSNDDIIIEENCSSSSYNFLAKSLSSNYGWEENSSTSYAVGNNQSINNTTGFNAYPTGFRGTGGEYYNEGKVLNFWGIPECDEQDMYLTRYLTYSTFELGKLFYSFNDAVNFKKNGMSVRLVKD
jgi:uncharacterized protein (TIGR02145 family)